MKKMRVATIKNIVEGKLHSTPSDPYKLTFAFNESAQRDRQLVTRSTSTRLILALYRENIIQIDMYLNHSKGISCCFCQIQT